MSKQQDYRYRVLGTADDGKVEIILYRPEFYDEFTDILHNSLDSLLQSSGNVRNACSGVDSNNHTEETAAAGAHPPGVIVTYAKRTLAEGLSLVARDTTCSTNRIVGYVMNTLLVQEQWQQDASTTTSSDEPPPPDAHQQQLQAARRASRELSRLLNELEAPKNDVDLFTHCGSDVLVRMILLVVRPAFVRRGIAGKLVECTLQLVRERKAAADGVAVPAARDALLNRCGGVVGVFTSRFSQRIAERWEFCVHLEAPYEEMHFAGRMLQEKENPPDGTQQQKLIKVMSLSV